jgi:hypothetical protein
MPQWKAGVATTAITPFERMWLAGWAARRKPAEGKAAELFAKALALEDPSGKRVLVVTADLIAIPHEIARAVSGQIQACWNIPKEQLLLNASHTHAGPELRPDKVPFFEIPEEFAAKIGPYAWALPHKIVSTCAAALASLQPVSLAVHRATAGFARNRRPAGGPVDHDVPILQVARADGRPLAILFGYACHNLTLPSSFCEYHGDYAGIAQSELESAFPGATAMFLAGAGADQDPAPRGSLELTQEHGQALASAIKQSSSEPGSPISGGLSAAFDEISLEFLPLPSSQELEADAASDDPPRQRKAKFLLRALEEKRLLPTSYPCPVQVLRFGNELLLIALAGEPVAEYALRFKSEFAGPLVWVAGYSNGMVGYLPTQRIQREGGYEAGRAMLWSPLPTMYAETLEERLVEAVRRLVKLGR